MVQKLVIQYNEIGIVEITNLKENNRCHQKVVKSIYVINTSSDEEIF